MIRTVILLVIGFLIPGLLFAEENEPKYSEVAWHNYQAVRICLEAYIQPGNGIETFERCLRVQNTAKLIYDGIWMDEKRRWLTETPPVKKYLTDRGLKPLDYLLILKLMSEGHANKIKSE